MLFLLTSLGACKQSTTKQAQENNTSEKFIKGSNLQIGFEEIIKNLNSPIAMVDASDEKSRFLIAEQGGTIRVFEDGKMLEKPFLNVKNKMIKLNEFYDERGLLGLALHPNYTNNGLFYIYYSAPSNIKNNNCKNIIAEGKVSEDKNIASEELRVILEIEKPESNHNGGQLAFGKDGYLYIAVGDGGGADDQHGADGNGQSLQTHLGKILRIDINTKPYSIPNDNPFLNGKGLPEIYAYGLRNPWRFSFDKETGKLFCADVGQNEYEEINIIENGDNCGWRIMEGLHCFNPSDGCDKTGLKMPVHEYSHDVGQSATGGFVYRGSEIPTINGLYIYADWTGPLFYLYEENGLWKSGNVEVKNREEDLRILSFGEDKYGELYVLTSKEVSPSSFTGSVYKIIK